MMPLEIEVKMRVQDHEPVRRALKAGGAKFVKRQLETNAFCDTPGGHLLNSGCGLRVRSARDLESGGVDVIITHKGPRRPGPMKIREETELRVESLDDAIRLLRQLGYEGVLSFEKRRETWQMDECEVVLDELPHGLGRFVEIEGKDEQCVQALRTKLALDAAATVPESYAHIVSEHLKNSGESRLTFEG